MSNLKGLKANSGMHVTVWRQLAMELPSIPESAVRPSRGPHRTFSGVPHSPVEERLRLALGVDVSQDSESSDLR
jgi:hypothetical protein